MHRITRSCLTMLLLLVASTLAEGQAARRTLNGTYLWEQGGDRGNLEAVFTPAGDRHWNVDFHFTFNGADHTYSGTADGRLDEGVLSGRVSSDGRQRVFTFRGTFENGRFRGTHAEVSRGGEERTGTLTLGASP